MSASTLPLPSPLAAPGLAATAGRALSETEFQLRMGQFLETEMDSVQRQLAARLVACVAQQGWQVERMDPTLQLLSGYGCRMHRYALREQLQGSFLLLTLSHVVDWPGLRRAQAMLAVPLSWSSRMVATLALVDAQERVIAPLASHQLAVVAVPLSTFDQLDTAIADAGSQLAERLAAPELFAPFAEQLAEQLSP